MIRRSANAPALIPLSQQSEADQKAFFERLIELRPEMRLPTDESITEMKKCIEQGSYIPSEEALEWLSKVR